MEQDSVREIIPIPGQVLPAVVKSDYMFRIPRHFI